MPDRHLYMIGTFCQRMDVMNPTQTETSYMTSYEFEATPEDATEIVELRVRETHPHQSNWKVNHAVTIIPDEYVCAVADAIRGGRWINPLE